MAVIWKTNRESMKGDEMMLPLKPGDRIRIVPFEEEAEVFLIQQMDNQVILGIILYPSQRAQRLVLGVNELTQRVQKLPGPWEGFQENALIRDIFLLFLEAFRMRLAYAFDPHYAISVTQVDLLPHQVDAVYQHILPMPRIRFLLADDPGLGKTIMAGLVMKELKARGLLRRVLLIVPAHLQDQWQREMQDWFREDFVILRRELLSSLYAADFFERNPQVLVSMDFARKEEVRELLARQWWDLVIVDEAHKLSATRYGQKVNKTKRYQLGEAIASKTTHLLFLTATPHKGDDDAYFLLLSLLEPRLFANPTQLKAVARSEGLPFVLRRTKEQVVDLQGRKLFRKRTVQTLGVQLTEAEKLLYDAVTNYVRQWYANVADKKDRRSRNVALALTVLQRRLSSSLYAVRESLRRRKSKLQSLLHEWERRQQEEDLPEWDEDAIQDLAEMTAQEWENFQERLEGLTAARTLEELQEELKELDGLIRLALEAERAGEEAKIQELRRVAEERLRRHPDEKLLVFTEFKDTLTALERRFREWGFPCAVVHGQMNLQARVAEERRFRDEVQVMVATDAAGEGINLQFCRLMVNYDLPWNPNRLEQRMGRIHRYGQQRDCFIFNLLHPDTREGKVLERLMEKLELMRQRLGDTVYDVIGTLLEGVRLEDLIMQAILKGNAPELEQVLEVDISRRVEEFQRILQENALASHHIDLSVVQRGNTDSLLWRLVPWDVERFTRLAVQTVGGQITQDRRHPKVFRISVPREFLRQHGLQDEAFVRGIRVAFEREIARRENAEFFAPGHPLLEALIDHCLNKNRPVRTILMDEKGRNGTLWLYRVQIQDGAQRPVLERLLTLFHDRQTGEVREVDPRMLWELQPFPGDASIPDDFLTSLPNAYESTRSFSLNRLQTFLAEAQERREREYTIKKQWLKMSYDALVKESQEKLFDYHRRASGEDMRLAIQQEEENLKTLIREYEERLNALERERQLTPMEPQLEAIALIVPKTLVVPPSTGDEEEMKRRVEEAGIKIAMDHERSQGRQPEDVSQQFLGYDLISRSDSETRFIEVKAFATTGMPELTLHEWQMAERLQ
ncbi:MAG: DEAD/DEAH box helicase family protein, partial [Candidatus Caldatribacterium sp.]|nr:DEAD/DEAH box helicase family protein [Candidatus Caldatribacterium sp.]